VSDVDVCYMVVCPSGRSQFVEVFRIRVSLLQPESGRSLPPLGFLDVC
jgi:hypothetical protein